MNNDIPWGVSWSLRLFLVLFIFGIPLIYFFGFNRYLIEYSFLFLLLFIPMFFLIGPNISETLRLAEKEKEKFKDGEDIKRIRKFLRISLAIFFFSYMGIAILLGPSNKIWMGVLFLFALTLFMLILNWQISKLGMSNRAVIIGLKAVVMYIIIITILSIFS